MGRQVFGCDICQDVCPWNAKALRAGLVSGLAAADDELAPRVELINPALEELAALDESAFEARFNGSPVRRAGWNGLRRNVAVAMGNSGLARFSGKLEAWAGEADEGLRAAARWALDRLRR
jgi:epoxyqueuosine reductase